MTHQGDINRNARSAGLTAWLTLATVLLLQIGSVAHEAQHSLSDVGDVCEVCVQLESGSAADSRTVGAAAAPAPTDRIDVWIDAPVVVSSYRAPPLRAPPASI